jgi:hypothetical protein
LLQSGSVLSTKIHWELAAVHGVIPSRFHAQFEEIFAMTKLLMLAAASLMLSGSAFGQDKSQKSMTNCSPPSAAATPGSGGPTGQAVEKSAILPSAGGEVGSSAAPTVQRDGKSVEMRSDCPQEPAIAKGEKPKD